MDISVHSRATGIIVRLTMLLGVLRDGSISRPELLLRLGTAYPLTPSARRMIDRDIEHLRALGIVIERSEDRPPVYTLRGGTPLLNDDELRALALVRDTFGPRHPQTAQVHALLVRLTDRLSKGQQQVYTRRQALRAPVEPAIDYTPYLGLIRELEEAIGARQLLRFSYRSSRGQEALHRQVEPYDIEFYERHYYLVAYTHNSGQIHDFRISRIGSIERLQRMPPELARARSLITFRYRLAAPLAQDELSQRFEAQRVVERLENGDVIVEAAGRSAFFIVRTLLKYATSAELLEPAWLREELRREVVGLARLYAEG